MAEQQAPPIGAEAKRRKRIRCYECEACLRDDCGECQNCLRFAKFGGDGSCKNVCVHRRCDNLQPRGRRPLPTAALRRIGTKRKRPLGEEEDPEERKRNPKKISSLRFTADRPDEDVPWHRTRRSEMLTKHQLARRHASLREYLRIRVCQGDADVALTVAEGLADSLRAHFAKSGGKDGGGGDEGRGGDEVEAEGLRRLGEEWARPFDAAEYDEPPPSSASASGCGGGDGAYAGGGALAMALVRWEHHFAHRVDRARDAAALDEIEAEVKRWFGSARHRVARRRRAMEFAPYAAAAAAVAAADGAAPAAWAHPSEARREIRRLRWKLRSVALELERREREVGESTESLGKCLERDEKGRLVDDPDIDFERLIRLKRDKRATAVADYLGVKKLDRLIAAGITTGRQLLRIWDDRGRGEGGKAALERVYSTLRGRASDRPVIVERWAQGLREEFQRRGEGAGGDGGAPIAAAAAVDLSVVRAKADELEEDVRRTLDPTERVWRAAANAAEERRRELAKGRLVCVHCGRDATVVDANADADADDEAEAEVDPPPGAEEEPTPAEPTPAEMEAMAAAEDVVIDPADDAPEDNGDPNLDFARRLRDYGKHKNKTCAALAGLGEKRLESLLAAGVKSGRDLVRVWVNRNKGEAGRRRMSVVRGALSSNQKESNQMLMFRRRATLLAKELLERDRRRAAKAEDGDGSAPSEEVQEEAEDPGEEMREDEARGKTDSPTPAGSVAKSPAPKPAEALAAMAAAAAAQSPLDASDGDPAADFPTAASEAEAAPASPPAPARAPDPPGGGPFPSPARAAAARAEPAPSAPPAARKKTGPAATAAAVAAAGSSPKKRRAGAASARGGPVPAPNFAALPPLPPPVPPPYPWPFAGGPFHPFAYPAPPVAVPPAPFSALVRAEPPPRGISWRVFCRKCGRKKTEHGGSNGRPQGSDFGLVKCTHGSCGKCGARPEFHAAAGSPMGFYCRLRVEEGASSVMCARYLDMLERATNAANAPKAGK